jgi:hypothetical protein
VIAGAGLIWWWFRPVPTHAPTAGEVPAAAISNSDSVNDINSGVEASAVGEFDGEFDSIDAELNNL